MTIGFTLLCGIAYPLAVTGVGQAVMPHQANGSLIGFIGEPCVNVLALNRQLDAMSATKGK